MPESEINSPRELKAFLAQRTVLDPLNELGVLVELLESSALSRASIHTKIEMLEILWPSIEGLLDVFEHQLNGSLQKQCYAENTVFLSFERLAKLSQQSYSEAALSQHSKFKPLWGKDPRETVLNRAINLSARIALARLSLYMPLEPGYWHNLYILWQETENAKLFEKLSNKSNDMPIGLKLGEILIGLCIIATLPSNALPSQEIRPLLACFVHYASTNQVRHDTPTDTGEWIGINFEHDIPPRRYIPNLDEGSQAIHHASRYIVLEPLVNAIQEILSNVSGDFIYISDCAVLISRSTLERVISHLQQPVKPRCERPRAHGQCYLYTGISVIHQLLLGSLPGQLNCTHEPSSPRLVQEGIDTPPQATNLIEKPASNTEPDALWDMVGRGHLIYEPPHPSAGMQTDANIFSSQTTRRTAQPWDIEDVSADGVHLRSAHHKKDDTILSIGNLVLVEIQNKTSSSYIIGILRWESNPGASIYELGIETLAHEARPIRVSGSHQNTSEWYDALMLPPSPRSEHSLLVLPNQEYRMGASVMALLPTAPTNPDETNQHEPMLEYILGQKIMQTTSVCVFQFRDTSESTQPDSSTTRAFGASS